MHKLLARVLQNEKPTQVGEIRSERSSQTEKSLENIQDGHVTNIILLNFNSSTDQVFISYIDHFLFTKMPIPLPTLQ